MARASLTNFSFPVSAELQDPEGIAFNPDNNHLFIVSGPDNAVAEFALNGSFVEEYDIGTGLTPPQIAPQGATFGLTSDEFDDPNAIALYLADGGGDQVPDGGIYEKQVAGVTILMTCRSGVLSSHTKKKGGKH